MINKSNSGGLRKAATKKIKTNKTVWLPEVGDLCALNDEQYIALSPSAEYKKNLYYNHPSVLIEKNTTFVIASKLGAIFFCLFKGGYAYLIINNSGHNFENFISTQDVKFLRKL